MRNKIGALIAFTAAVVAANYLTSKYGLIPVGFGLVATAGTYAAGLTFMLRDWVHETGGRSLAVIAVIIGAALSWWLATPVLAIASGITFLIAELADLAVYVPLRRRGLIVAAIASNIVGFTLDTFLFLHLAGFPITPSVILGQLWVKAAMTALGVAAIWLFTRRRVAVGAA